MTIDRIPETQLESWDQLKGHLSARQTVVLEAIKEKPATLFELVTRLGLPVNRISGRVNELATKGKVKDSGSRRKNPASGKSGIVWEATTTLVEQELF